MRTNHLRVPSVLTCFGHDFGDFDHKLFFANSMR